MTADAAPRPCPYPVGQNFVHRAADPGARTVTARLYQAAAHRHVLHTGVSARRRRRLPRARKR